MRQYRAILVALATAAAAAFGACGDDSKGGGSVHCERLEHDASNTGCTVTAYECEDQSEYTIDCLVTADGYDCKCRIDNTIDSEFSSADYCDDPNASFNEPCGWSVGP